MGWGEGGTNGVQPKMVRSEKPRWLVDKLVVFPHHVGGLGVYRVWEGGGSTLAHTACSIRKCSSGRRSPAELALYVPLSLATTSAATSSSSMLTTNETKHVGCLRSLQSGLLRNTQNSFGTSRSVLDPSWFGWRPFPCVKGSYLHERSRIV